MKTIKRYPPSRPTIPRGSLLEMPEELSRIYHHWCSKNRLNTIRAEVIMRENFFRGRPVPPDVTDPRKE